MLTSELITKLISRISIFSDNKLGQSIQKCSEETNRSAELCRNSFLHEMFKISHNTKKLFFFLVINPEKEEEKN